MIEDLGMTEEEAQAASAAHEPDNDDAPKPNGEGWEWEHLGSAEEVPAHALAQQAVRDTGLCGEFVSGSALCMKIAGHEPPCGSGVLQTAVADPLTAPAITAAELVYMNKLISDMKEANSFQQRLEALRAEASQIEAEIIARNTRFEGYFGHLATRYGFSLSDAIDTQDGTIQRS